MLSKSMPAGPRFWRVMRPRRRMSPLQLRARTISDGSASRLSCDVPYVFYDRKWRMGASTFTSIAAHKRRLNQ